MRRRPPRSTLDRSAAASDVYKRQVEDRALEVVGARFGHQVDGRRGVMPVARRQRATGLSLIHISEPTRPY